VVKNRSIKAQLAAYYSDEDSARKSAAILEGLISISKMGKLLPSISEDEEVQALLNLLGKTEIDRRGVCVTIGLKASLGEIKQLVELTKYAS